MSQLSTSRVTRFWVERVVLGTIRYRVMSVEGIHASYAERRKATAKTKSLNAAYAN